MKKRLAYYVLDAERYFLEDEFRNQLMEEGPDESKVDFMLRCYAFARAHNYEIVEDHRFIYDYPSVYDDFWVKHSPIEHGGYEYRTINRPSLTYIHTDNQAFVCFLSQLPNGKFIVECSEEFDEAFVIYADEEEARSVLFQTLNRMRLRALL